jgi:predicted RNA-binding Zn-ribbon protein involved in translation (DUF1610 family)
MKFDAIWPRHIPKGLSLSRDRIRTINQKARLARKRESNFRGAGRRFVLLYLPIALPAFGIYLVLSAQHDLIAGVTFLGLLIPYVLSCKQRTLAPYIRRALCEEGYEVCIDCGYLLRGLQYETAKCPECGTARIEQHRELGRLREADEARLARPPRAQP